MLLLINIISKNAPAPGSRAFISSEKLSQLQGSIEQDDNSIAEEPFGVSPNTNAKSQKG